MKTRWHAKLIMVVMILGLMVGLLVGCGGTTTVTETKTVTTTAAGAGATVTQTLTQTATVTKTPAPATTTTQTGIAPAKKIIIKVGDAWADNNNVNMAIKWLCDDIEARSGGRVGFEYYWAGSVAKAKEEMNAVKTGLLDLTVFHPMYYPTELPLTFWPWCMPTGLTSNKAYVTIMEKLVQKVPAVQKELSSISDVHVFTSDPTQGKYAFGAWFRINDIMTDVSGKKLNVSGEWQPKWWQALGAQTRPITTAELYTSMQTHACDGNVGPMALMTDLKLWEVGVKYYLDLEQGPRNGGWPAMNLNTWNKLPADIQKMFTDGIPLMAVKAAEIVDDKDNTAVANAKQLGLDFYTLPADQKAKWSALIQPIVLDWIKSLEAKGLPGTEMVKAIQDISAEIGSPTIKYVQ